jgi:hypothetical protein
MRPRLTRYRPAEISAGQRNSRSFAALRMTERLAGFRECPLDEDIERRAGR